MAGRKVKNDDTAPPRNPQVGDPWFDQMLGRVRRWDGKEWADHVPGSLHNNNQFGIHEEQWSGLFAARRARKRRNDLLREAP